MSQVPFNLDKSIIDNKDRYFAQNHSVVYILPESKIFSASLFCLLKQHKREELLTKKKKL
jgi:hypothetical protein